MLNLPWLYDMNYRAARRLAAWGVLCVALLTYLLTLEPTASYWDCPEYISVATGLQPGHPPGNPMWMLAARFFVNFAPGPEYRALAVNVMSAVCASLTVMLLFLTIEFFARRLLRPVTRASSLLCLGASLTGALAFCWSDSFWFSAVEAEVYAFSSLCTALLFWLSLVWYEHRREPHSDRYLILLAYLTGLTIGVHELNLLCLPALLLVVAYGMREELPRWRIAVALLAGLGAIALALYGVIPGFMALAKRVELLCVNTLGMPFNSGLLITWTLVSVTLVGAGVWLNGACWRRRRLLRLLRVGVWSLFMMLLGFSCYALLIIRASANPPLDSGHPADIFSFSSYFARDQYGSAPLVYGAPFTAQPMRLRTVEDGDTFYSRYAVSACEPRYVRGVPGMPHAVSGYFGTREDSMRNAALQARGGDWYQVSSHTFEKRYPPELHMWFPRMHSHSEGDVTGYFNWLDTDERTMTAPGHVTLAVDEDGDPVEIPSGRSPVQRHQVRPTYLQNLQYFTMYQCAYMYWRYFMWNFVGRQNDYTGHGEPDAGNFITGIDALDCLMLDVAAEAPANVGKGNKGRNVYFALPLILGLMGLGWQLCQGKRGRRQALLIAVLFILTGIAIVVYLNQGPVQARDRDYSFLGSWYAFCIWIGLGTLCVWSLVRICLPRHPRLQTYLSAGLALCVPVQMLSQTWDDHDRSGRTVTRDMAYNMISSVGNQAVIFSSQDNNIFPLWFATEAEGLRPDVRVISAPYMSLSWYPGQWLMPMRESRPLAMTAPRGLLASDMLGFVKMGSDTTWTLATEALRRLYSQGICDYMADPSQSYPLLETPRVYFVMEGDTVRIDLGRGASGRRFTLLDAGELLTLDIMATNAESPHPRPLYWTRPLGEEMFGGQLKPYLERIGTLQRLNPANPGLNARETARLALTAWRFGTRPGVLEGGKEPYFDPVAAHNLALFRSSLIESAKALSESGSRAEALMALTLLEKIERKIPATMVPYEAIPLEPEVFGLHRVPRYADEGLMAADTYLAIAATLDRPDLRGRGEALRENRLEELRAIDRYRNSLRESYRPFVTYRLEYLLYVLHPLPAPDTLSLFH